MSIIAAECSRIAGGGSDGPLLATLAPTWPPTPPAPSWYKIMQLIIVKRLSLGGKLDEMLKVAPYIMLGK